MRKPLRRLSLSQKLIKLGRKFRMNPNLSKLRMKFSPNLKLRRTQLLQSKCQPKKLKRQRKMLNVSARENVRELKTLSRLKKLVSKMKFQQCQSSQMNKILTGEISNWKILTVQDMETKTMKS